MSPGASRKPIPARSKGDIAIVATRAAVSARPVVGSPVAELMALLRAPLEKRQEEWWVDLAQRMAKLEEDGRIRLDGIGENESFLNAAARAATAAVRTGQTEKRAALRNAVLHAALDSYPDEGEQYMSLEMVDRFTVWHLRVLAPRPFRPEDLLSQVWADLKQAGVRADLEGMMTEHGWQSSATTEAGQRFLRLIEEP